MGCTSSAPKMVKPRSNSAVDPAQEEHQTEETKDTSKEIEKHVNLETETNVANVLPNNMCDNLLDPTQLDRNNKIFDAPPKSDNNVKDHQLSGHTELDHKINMDDKNEATSNSAEEKLSKLEEVVDKVVEMYIAEGGIVGYSTIPGTTEDANVTEEDSGTNKIKNDIEHPTADSELIETTWWIPCILLSGGKVEREAETLSINTNEGRGKSLHRGNSADQPAASAAVVVSPSQSESGRATRWEALADVAAELPPSLAVDPITGQIYALSK